MGELLRSMLLGTAGLTIMTLAALWLSIARREIVATPTVRRRLQILVAFVIAVQVAHFTEEAIATFQTRFPELLGLVPWPIEFFVSVNFFWIALWVLSAFALRRRTSWALFPIWLLAIGSAVNGVAHPALALMDGGYFPGLLTSPLSGVAGILLLRRLTAFTEARSALRPG